MANATFVHSGGTVTFTRAPQRPAQSLAVLQPRRQSAGGVRFGFTRTIAETIIRLPLRMTTVQKEALLTFFNTTVNGMAYPFTFTDPFGSAISCRFNAPRLANILEKGYDAWEATVELKVIS